MLSSHGIYPLTIIADRYQGAYSNGRFLAFNLNEKNIPPDPSGDDITCMDFWDYYKAGIGTVGNILIGIGDTPTKAFNNLKHKINGTFKSKIKKKQKERLEARIREWERNPVNVASQHRHTKPGSNKK